MAREKTLTAGTAKEDDQLTPQARALRARYEDWKAEIRRIQPEYDAWLARRAEEFR